VSAIDTATLDRLPPWLHPGQEVAIIKRPHYGCPKISRTTVERATKTLVVLADGTRVKTRDVNPSSKRVSWYPGTGYATNNYTVTPSCSPDAEKAERDARPYAADSACAAWTRAIVDRDRLAVKAALALLLAVEDPNQLALDAIAALSREKP